MNELMAVWAEWMRPSAGLPTVQWSLLLALAAAVGHLLQRHVGLPKAVGYSAVGALAGLAGFSGVAWPLQGIALFLLELGVSIVLFEAGGRVALRWFFHNPMVLLQSVLGSTLAAVAVYYALRALEVPPHVAEALALVAMAGSPAVLSRVAIDTRAGGPVTERATALTTLSALYALALVSSRVGVLDRPHTTLGEALLPVGVVLGISFVVGALLALALRTALRFMSPTSENTSMLLFALIAAATAIAAHFGGSAPLAALLGGMLLKQLNPRPWAWPRQMGTAASLLTTLTLVVVAVVAARADWNPAIAGLVAALVLARSAGQVFGVWTANWRSGTSFSQAFWTGCAMSPMASLSLLLVQQFAASSAPFGGAVAAIALPAILLMEVLGAIIATVALHRAGESALPQAAETPAVSPGLEARGEARGEAHG